jgi:hypothetical protein
MDAVTIDARFCGPPGSANGGYTCGRVAAALGDGPAEVTLRVPPPLDRPLALEARDDRVVLLDGDVLVAEGRRADAPDVEPPAPIGADEARRAAARHPWEDTHPYPTCFVCGTGRATGDGLRIFCGPTDDGARFAAPWTPPAELAGPDGAVAPEFVWAALDCPSGIATVGWDDVQRILLGRLTAELRAPVAAGAEHVLQAWTLARDGRKLHTASALYDADGRVLACARAVWIELPAS